MRRPSGGHAAGTAGCSTPSWATEFADFGRTAHAAHRFQLHRVSLRPGDQSRALGIGFFTPVGFLEEIRRPASWCMWPLAEPGLAQSRIGIPGAALSPPSRRRPRLMINHISEPPARPSAIF